MAVVMTLLFIMSGLGQFNAEPYEAARAAGGELNWVVSEGTGGPFTSPRPVDAAQ